MRNWLTRLLLAVLAVLAVVLPAAAPAQAAPWDVCTMSEASAMPYLSDWSGSSLSFGELGGYLGRPGVGATAYEWWGSGALAFTTNREFNNDTASAETLLTCDNGNFATRSLTALVDIPFRAAVGVNEVGLWLTQEAMSLNILPLFAEKVLVPLTQGNAQTSGLADGYRQGFILVIVLTAIWAAWRIIRSRLRPGSGGVKEALLGVGWNIGMSILGLVLIAFPLLLPNAVGGAVQLGQGAVGGVTRAITDGMTDGSDITALCSLGDDVAENTSVDVADPTSPTGVTTITMPSKSTRQAVCTMWASTVLTSWARGQFGNGEAATQSYVNSDGVADPGVWDKTTGDPTIATYIPGLANQPPADSLPLLQLNALSLNAAEQAWLDAQPDHNAALRQLIAGQPGDYSTYPAADVAATSGLDSAAVTGVNTMGHQQRWDILRDRVNETGQMGVVSAWSGGAPTSTMTRVAATLYLGIGTAAMTLPMTVFAIALTWYQLALGLMFAFLGFVMLLSALPQVGRQFLKDYINKVIKYLLMLLMTLGLMSLVPIAAFVIPSKVFTSFSPLVQMTPQAIVYFYLLAMAGSIALIVLWWKASKGLKARTMVRGANENSAFDLAGRSVNKVEEAARNTAHAAGAVVAGAATGGAAGAAMAASTVGMAAVSGGKGNMERQARRVMTETVDGLKPSGRTSTGPDSTDAGDPAPQTRRRRSSRTTSQPDVVEETTSAPTPAAAPRVATDNPTVGEEVTTSGLIVPTGPVSHPSRRARESHFTPTASAPETTPTGTPEPNATPAPVVNVTVHTPPAQAPTAPLVSTTAATPPPPAPSATPPAAPQPAVHLEHTSEENAPPLVSTVRSRPAEVSEPVAAADEVGAVAPTPARRQRRRGPADADRSTETT